jgi:hypothetical protein
MEKRIKKSPATALADSAEFRIATGKGENAK